MRKHLRIELGQNITCAVCKNWHTLGLAFGRSAYVCVRCITGALEELSAAPVAEPTIEGPEDGFDMSIHRR